MKKVLGLDIGTNSIGWALIEHDFTNKKGRIINAGSRIIPMAQDQINDFDKGNSKSKTAERTRLRGIRRLRERHLLRRERLHRVLNILGFLPSHYQNQIDFEKKLGQFLPNKEPKIPYDENNQFIFKNSYFEMLSQFKDLQPDILKKTNGSDALIPYDWTIYYLRSKALKQKISEEELAWVILNFNQKRGYYQLRGEEDEVQENVDKLTEYHALKVIDVAAENELYKNSGQWYNIILENGWIYRRTSKTSLDNWKGKVKEFIVTTELNEDGSVKTTGEGKEKRSFRAPQENDWTLLKTKTQAEIENSKCTVGEYIYNNILANPNQKIRGKLVRTIERKYYKEELEKILTVQSNFHQNLKDISLYEKSIKHLYSQNISYQKNILKRSFLYLIVNDIIFHQRPLKSKKSLISNCPFEARRYNFNGNQIIEPLKCISKSHPIFQEFRLWQWISNLKIYNNDIDYTSDFLNDQSAYVDFFEYLNEKKSFKEYDVLKYLLSKAGIKSQNIKVESTKYRWNYVKDKEYPGNETRNLILTRLAKVNQLPEGFLNQEIELQLWHLIYSVKDKSEYKKGLKKFANRFNINEESFLESFEKIPPLKNEYGSFSYKAINKLLPLIRMGKFWNINNIDKKTLSRIENIINAIDDETIINRVREKAIKLTHVTDFSGLPVWLACYIVYNRHSENAENIKWRYPKDIDNFLSKFKQHSLRNPIVEQIILESLKVVKDIWMEYGNSEPDYFDEIHIELGREMKNPSNIRAEMTKRINENENTNLRIKALLIELMNDHQIEGLNAYSSSQQELMKLYEDGAINAAKEIPDDISKIIKSSNPTSSDLKKYKLWLEQRYRSPYTGQIIPLHKLFSAAYEIEHVFPKSRYFDDSLSNKVICESEINKLKNKQTALEFIINHGDSIVELSEKRKTRILSKEEYINFVNDNYQKNFLKRKKLLMEDIPDGMIERQMNDTRYISIYVMKLMSNIVRSDDGKDDSFNSKNIIPVTGQITNVLKSDWGLNDVWNDIILPRFKRLNEVQNTSEFTYYSKNHHKEIPTIPFKFAKGFQRKRIDHRHHALDAIVIASITRNHINFLNNKCALSDKNNFDESNLSRYDLRQALCIKKFNDSNSENYSWVFTKPWDDFTPDVKNKLKFIVVSFKQNIRILTKATNKYDTYFTTFDTDQNSDQGNPIKTKKNQTLGINWAIRKPLHKDGVSGEIFLRRKKNVNISDALNNYQNIIDKSLKKYIKSLYNQGLSNSEIIKEFKSNNYKFLQNDLSKVEIYYFDNDLVAKRNVLDTSFNLKKIESITDHGIQKILLNHLNNYKGIKDENGNEIPPETLAFTSEGIADMNKNIANLNDFKNHKPILSVRISEIKGQKFQVGYTGNKSKKFVESAKGTNLFFAIYQDENGKRFFESVPLNLVIERKKQNLSLIPEFNKNGEKLLFYLSPNDLVYVPNEETNSHILNTKELSPENIYKMVSCNKSQCFFVPSTFASSIIDKVEFSSLNKMEKSINGIMIKNFCWKLEINRIGQINKIVSGYN